jgi:hypothetical protein
MLKMEPWRAVVANKWGCGGSKWSRGGYEDQWSSQQSGEEEQDTDHDAH